MALREILARFGIQVDSGQLAAANKGILGAIGSLRTFGSVIAGTAIVRGVKDFVSDMVSVGDELGKTSAQLGIGVQELQSWRIAAQLSGASTKELTVGIRTLAKNALTAQTSASGEAAKAFKQLGVETETTDGHLKDSTTLLRDTGLALARVETNSERAALAQQLLGRSGTKLLPLFAKGEKGLEELLSKLEEYGGGIGPDAVKLSEQAADEFLLFSVATDSLKSKLAVALLPIISQVVGAISKIVSQISKWLEGTNLIQAALLSLGGILANMGFAALGRIGIRSLLSLARTVLIPLAKFALLVLIVDDLITLFKGGDSVIGRVLDRLFGEGSAKVIVREIKSIGSALGDLIWNFNEVDRTADGFISDNETRFTKFASTLASSTDQIVQDFSRAWELAKLDLSIFINSIPGRIKQGIRDAQSAAIELGLAIVQGIADKIREEADAVLEALTDILDGAIQSVKDRFGIKSPSRVTGDEIGEPLAMGVPAGAERLAGKAARMSARALERAAGLGAVSVSAATKPAAGGVSGGVLFQSDIRVSVEGGTPPGDRQIAKLRQGVRRELDDNKRATLAALRQLGVA